MFRNDYIKLEQSRVSGVDMESGVYVVQKRHKRCPAKYLLISLLLVSLAIALLGYVAKMRHSAMILPVNKPGDNFPQESDMQVMQGNPTDNKVPPFPEETSGPLNIATTQLFVERTQNYNSPDASIGDTVETTLPSTEGWPAFVDSGNTPEYYDTDQSSTESHVTMENSTPSEIQLTVKPNRSGLFERLLSNLWYNKDKNTPDAILSTSTVSLSPTVNVSSVLNITDIAQNYSQGIAHSENTDSLSQNSTQTNSSDASDSSAVRAKSQTMFTPVVNDTLVNAKLSTTPPTLPPIGNTPPSCGDYPSSYVKDFVSHQLHVGGHEEQDLLQDFRRALQSNPSLGVIDIGGAQLALYSLVAASMKRHVVVIEPNHDCVENLNKMLELNELSQLATVQEFAVSNQKGFGRFLTGQGNASYVAPVDESDATLERIDNHVIVNVITLDDVLRYVTFDRAILKIDIAGGSQPPLFSAAAELFNKVKIHYVFMNWIYDENNEETAIRTITFLRGRQLEPRSSLQNGFSLVPAFFRYWPNYVIWVNSSPW